MYVCTIYFFKNKNENEIDNCILNAFKDDYRNLKLTWQFHSFNDRKSQELFIVFNLEMYSSSSDYKSSK